MYMAVCQNLVPLVNIKIAGKWMFIPLKMVLIGMDPYPYIHRSPLYDHMFVKSPTTRATGEPPFGGACVRDGLQLRDGLGRIQQEENVHLTWPDGLQLNKLYLWLVITNKTTFIVSSLCWVIFYTYNPIYKVYDPIYNQL